MSKSALVSKRIPHASAAVVNAPRETFRSFGASPADSDVQHGHVVVAVRHTAAVDEATKSDAGAASEEKQGTEPSVSAGLGEQAGANSGSLVAAGAAWAESWTAPLTPGPSRPPVAQETVPIHQLSKEHLIGLLDVAQQPPARPSSLGIQVSWTNRSASYVHSVHEMNDLFELESVDGIGGFYSFPDDSTLHLMAQKGAIVLHSGAEGTYARHRHGAIKSYLDTADIPTAPRRVRVPWLLIPALVCVAIGIYAWLALSSPTATVAWSTAAIVLEVADYAVGKRWKPKPDDGHWLVARYPAARPRFWGSQLFWAAIGAIGTVLAVVVAVIALLKG